MSPKGRWNVSDARRYGFAARYREQGSLYSAGEEAQLTADIARAAGLNPGRVLRSSLRDLVSGSVTVWPKGYR